MAGVAACSSRSSSKGTTLGDGGTCTPGTTLACLGPGRCEGVQVCATDGKSYEECGCEGGGSGGGGTGGGGSGGSSSAGKGGDAGQAGTGGSATAGSGGSPACADGDICSVGADSGICYFGTCCTGCISGGTCVGGMSPSACGRGGTSCQDCRQLLGGADGNCTDDPSCLNGVPMHYYVPMECHPDGACGYAQSPSCCPNGCNASGCL